MDHVVIGIIGVAVFLILVSAGMWLGFAAAIIGIIGVWILGDWQAMGGLAGVLPYRTTSSFTLSVLPMFIIMGYFAFYGGLTRDLFYTARQWFGHFPGGLAIASAFGAAGFGACCGSSTASAAIIGKVAIPEMRKYNYDLGLASGAVAASGTMASMIPPSVVMVIYGLITEESIGKLLIAGFIPGMLEAVLYSGMIWIRCWRNPKLGGALPAASWKERILSLRMVWGMLLLMGSVLGGLYFGVFTPTEAGGMGAIGAFLIALGLRKLTWQNLKESLLETGKTTAMIFVMLVGIMLFLRFLALSGLTKVFIISILGLPWPPMAIMALVIVIYLILGMFVSAMGMLMLTLPLVFPVIIQLGYDPIWFGVIAVRLCETAFITPPVAMNVYAVKGTSPDIPTGTIIRGTIPFLYMDLINIALLMVFPALATWLPSTMK
ncbi:TRAP transporter large permease [Chloroflexota bacterium]